MSDVVRRMAFWVVVLGGVTAMAAAGAAQAAAPEARLQAPVADATEWQYAEIEFTRGTSPWFPSGASGTGGDHLQWSTAGASADGRSWRDLASKMKIPVPDKAASAKLVVMDFLGSQGWELVDATVPTGQAAPSWTWTFKRRVR